jgi:hypothetical protein
MKLGSWFKRTGKRGFRFSLFVMSGATALVVAACYGMSDTMGFTYGNSAQYILANNCDGCHSGATPPGDYSTDSYAGVMGGGSDTEANVIAGDSNCTLLQKLNSDATHTLSTSEADELYDWIVRNNAQ